MASKVRPYDLVRIVSDRFRGDGAPPGTIGCVVDEYPTGAVEVEVSRPDGATIALFAAEQEELEKIDRASLGPAPELAPADRQVLDVLRRQGTDLRSPHHIDHYLYFPDKAVAERASQVLLGRKYTVDVRPAARGREWLVFVSHTCVLTPEIVAGTISEMESLAAAFGGEYDGWEADVEGPKR